jgi:hypothetical protein
MKTDLENLKFDGSVSIRLNLNQSTKIVVFHAAELEISDAVMVHHGKTETPVYPLKNRTDVEREYMVLTFERALKKGNWTLNVNFAGSLSDSMRGNAIEFRLFAVFFFTNLMQHFFV